MAPNLAAALQLLLVTDDRLLAGRDPVETCLRAVAGGATAVQLRLKDASDAELVDLARRMVAALPVPVFVNDRFEVAIAAGAHGVHLGPDDLPLEDAVSHAPSGFWIGASVGSVEEAERSGRADYWGIGPLRQTTTKSDAGPALGLDAARALRQLAGSRPCVVIGGVQPGDVVAVRAAGFAGVAVSGGILGSSDIAAAAAQYALQARRLRRGDIDPM